MITIEDSEYVALVTLAQAAIITLRENGHLADGDVCTLYDLRNATEHYLNIINKLPTTQD